MKPDKVGRIDAQKFWKLNKKLFPKSRDPPVAILDKRGNVLTEDNSIKDRVLEVYSERLEPNKINEHLKLYEKAVNNLCESRPKLTKSQKTEP